jgi:hypothetical protein
MARRYFRFPITQVELTARKAYCNMMHWLGYRDFVVAAQGAYFVVGTTDLIDRSIAWFGIWEEEQLEDLARVCDAVKTDYFFDIGANAGIYSVLFAVKKLAPQIVAFEPDPGNYAHLMANLHVNKLAAKVRALPLAVGAEAASPGSRTPTSRRRRRPVSPPIACARCASTTSSTFPARRWLSRWTSRAPSSTHSGEWSGRCATTAATSRSSSIPTVSTS